MTRAIDLQVRLTEYRNYCAYHSNPESFETWLKRMEGNAK